MTAFGGRDVFVAKYSRLGRLVWVKQAGAINGTGFETDSGLAIEVDAYGRGTVTGYFDGSTTFGIGEPRETTVTSLGGADIFVARFDRAGDLLWVNRSGGPSFPVVLDAGRGVSVDDAGNSYVTGYFAGAATFDSTDGSSMTLIDESGDAFVAKYSRDDHLRWVTQADGDELDQGASISVDSDGRTYVTGYFQGTARSALERTRKF